MTQSYDVRRSDWFIVALALVSVCGTRVVEKSILPILVMAVVLVATIIWSRDRKMSVLLLVVFAGLSFLNGTRALRDLRNAEFGQYLGVARVISDPQLSGTATQIVLDITGDRFVVYAYGPVAWRLLQVNVGEQIVVSGWRGRLSQVQAKRWVSRHVKGKFEIKTVQERRFTAAPLFRSAQRIRELVDGGAESFPFDERSLFTGLVIGDDSKQSEEMITAFRKSGLAHLVAVSGQNVAFVLAGLSPLLKRLSKPLRLFVTCGVLVWFVAITRVEPSVVRAAVMAGIATLSISIGRPTRTLRLLALTVIITILIDPLLAWSVGYFMSVGATAGLSLGSGPLARVIPGPRWLALLIGATVSAQIGVTPAVAFVFGLPTAIGIFTNVLAVPVASLVMLFGMPLSLFAGVLRGTVLSAFGSIIMWPVLIGVRWVWWVAALGARLSSTGMVNLGLWIAVFGVILLLLHRGARVVG